MNKELKELQKEFKGEYGIESISELPTTDILIYDLRSLPVNTGLDMEKIMWLFKEHKIVLYDSSHGGDTPHIANSTKEDIQFVETRTDRGQELINKINNDEL